MAESYGRFEYACRNKKKYDTEVEAKADAKRLRKRVGAKVKPYMCKHCGLWHNGHFRRLAVKVMKSKRQMKV